MIDFWILGRPQTLRTSMATLAVSALLICSTPTMLLANGGNGGGGGGGAGGAFGVAGGVGTAQNGGGGGGANAAGGNTSQGNGVGGAAGTSLSINGGNGTQSTTGADNLAGAGGGGGYTGNGAGAATVSNTGTLQGGNGGNGAICSGGSRGSGGGGAGGYGAVVTGSGANSNAAGASLIGGNGGNSGAAAGSSNAGNAGDGGNGIQFTAASASFTNDGSVSSGSGGSGGNATGSSNPGNGGAGGVGVQFSAATGSLTNSGTIIAGNGGNGGSSIPNTIAGRNGGVGGVGVQFVGANGTLANTGSITGGNGGAAGTGSVSGTVGAGGEGINGADLTITNSGSITGGLANAGAGSRANAVNFTSGTNLLELQAGSTITGNVVGGGTTDTLRFGGSTNSSFDVSQIGNSAQYQNFEAIAKNGTSTWTLTGSNTFAGNTTISAGTLNFDSADNFGTGNVNMSGGTLQWATGTTTDISSRFGTLSGTFTFDTNGNNVAFNTAVTGATQYNIAGAGSLTLNNTISGTTIAVAGGTLALGASDRIADGSNLAISGGGTFAMGSLNETINSLTVNNGNIIGTGTLTSNFANITLQTGSISANLAGTNIVKSGSGTMTLSGANAYTGNTQIQNGTLALGANNTLPSTTNIQITNGTLAMGSFNNSITSISTFGSAGTSVSITGTGTLTGTGNFTLNNGTISANLAGSAGLTKNSTATVILSGTNSYTGGTTVNNGTLQGTTDSLQGTITNNATVVFDQTTTGTYAGNMGGSGTVTKQNTGTVIFTGANTYGATSITAGTLLMNGSATGAFNVNGGTLGGSGSVGATTVNSGFIAPGNSIDTLTVNGSFTQNAGGTYQCEVASNGTSDLISATGAASLNGTLNVATTGSGFISGTQYTILTAGSVAGTYSTVTDSFTFLDPQVSYLANSVVITLTYGSNAFASIAQTPNELQVGRYLDQVAPTTTGGDFLTVLDNLNLLSTDQARTAYNQMSGEAHATSAQATINTTTLMVQQVGNHLSSLSFLGPNSGSGFGGTNLMAQVSPTSTPAASPIQQVAYSPMAASQDSSSYLFSNRCENEKLWNGWSVGYGLGGSAQSDGNASGASYGVGGFLAGVDRWIDDRTLVGVFGGYLGSGFSTGTPSANVHNNAGQGGIYALRRGDVFYASALIGGQADNYTSQRNINFGAINRTATGNYDGWQGFGYTELGANLTARQTTLQPFGAFQYVHLRQNSISETGAGSLNLFSAGNDTDSLRSFLGTRLRYDNHGENNRRRFIPEVQASWLHEYADSSSSITSRFGAVGGTGFTATGLNVGRDWALLGAGMTYVVTDNIRLTANYYSQTNDRQTYHVGAGGLSIQW